MFPRAECAAAPSLTPPSASSRYMNPSQATQITMGFASAAAARKFLGFNNTTNNNFNNNNNNAGGGHFSEGNSWQVRENLLARQNQPATATAAAAAPARYNASHEFGGGNPRRNVTYAAAASGRYGAATSGGYGAAASGGYGAATSGGYGAAASVGYGTAASGGYSAAAVEDGEIHSKTSAPWLNKIELVVYDLDYNMTPEEWKCIVLNDFAKNNKVEIREVNSFNDENDRDRNYVVMQVGSMDQARQVHKEHNGKRHGYKKIKIGLVTAYRPDGIPAKWTSDMREWRSFDRPGQLRADLREKHTANITKILRANKSRMPLHTFLDTLQDLCNYRLTVYYMNTWFPKLVRVSSKAPWEESWIELLDQ